jgi:hypothetical protein
MIHPRRWIAILFDDDGAAPGTDFVSVNRPGAGPFRTCLIASINGSVLTASRLSSCLTRSRTLTVLTGSRNSTVLTEVWA